MARDKYVKMQYILEKVKAMKELYKQMQPSQDWERHLIFHLSHLSPSS